MRCFYGQFIYPLSFNAKAVHYIIFRKTSYYKPLVSVPSTYSKTKESDLIKNGFKIVIYANHMLRAAYPSMQNAAKTILKNQNIYLHK